MIKGQIFSSPTCSDSVNKHIIIVRQLFFLFLLPCFIFLHEAVCRVVNLSHGPNHSITYNPSMEIFIAFFINKAYKWENYSLLNWKVCATNTCLRRVILWLMLRSVLEQLVSGGRAISPQSSFFSCEGEMQIRNKAKLASFLSVNICHIWLS